MTAQELFAAKRCVPSRLSSKGWNLVPVNVRERSFFLSGVDRLEVLQVYHSAVSRYVEGDLNAAEARRAIREGLAAIGYSAEPGDEGTMRDLLFFDRMKSILDMNASMLANSASRASQWPAYRVFPAVRNVWMSSNPMPKSWLSRWEEAAQGLPCAHAGSMTALLDSPVGARLSRFGIPHSPYGFGCGMGDLAVRIDLAVPLLGSDVVSAFLKRASKAL